MKRTLLFVLGGLLLGGIVHVAVVFMVPLFADNDAWAQMNRFGGNDVFHVLPMPTADAEQVASLDPRMAEAVCTFNLADGPLRVRATLPDRFWSVAVFDRRGRNVYSLNDRAADRHSLDLAILTPVEMARFRQKAPDTLDSTLVVQVPIDLSFVLLRVFVPDSSTLSEALGALSGAECGNLL